MRVGPLEQQVGRNREEGGRKGKNCRVYKYTKPNEKHMKIHITPVISTGKCDNKLVMHTFFSVFIFQIGEFFILLKS